MNLCQPLGCRPCASCAPFAGLSVGLPVPRISTIGKLSQHIGPQATYRSRRNSLQMDPFDRFDQTAGCRQAVRLLILCKLSQCFPFRLVRPLCGQKAPTKAVKHTVNQSHRKKNYNKL